ncbi:hypothetical protein EVA_06624 [gut metagenome]|uniref:Uncharacterized protein n=1 Tax=gut metagenome TaxID=749906 RepID=J9GRR4_9ZZZZ
MARRTTQQIELEMYAALDAFLKGKINGNFFLEGCRPHDSENEDAVIGVSTATAEQVQEGRARLRIYVKDIDAGTGNNVPDKGRLAALAELSEGALQALSKANADYWFELKKAPETIEVPGANQHFVNIEFDFKIKTF